MAGARRPWAHPSPSPGHAQKQTSRPRLKHAVRPRLRLIASQAAKLNADGPCSSTRPRSLSTLPLAVWFHLLVKRKRPRFTGCLKVKIIGKYTRPITLSRGARPSDPWPAGWVHQQLLPPPLRSSPTESMSWVSSSRGVAATRDWWWRRIVG
jgi:hypothetical protein